MKLQSFLKSRGLSHDDFAAQIGVSRTAVVRYCNGARRPDWPVLERIEQVTNGKVRPKDFYEAGGVDAPPPQAA